MHTCTLSSGAGMAMKARMILASVAGHSEEEQNPQNRSGEHEERDRPDAVDDVDPRAKAQTMQGD